MIIRGNTVYGNQELIPWAKMGKVTDGNGIIIDTLRNNDTGVEGGAYRGRTLIENNVVSNNGGRGIAVFQSDHVDIVSNTTFHNSQHPDVRDGEITAITASDVRVFNNILYASTGLPANTVFDSTNVTYDYNLVFNSTAFTTSASHNKVGQDPRFVNPEIGDFSLQPDSPALNTAGGSLMATVDLNGRQRRQGGKPDLGAIERMSSSSTLSNRSNDSQPITFRGSGRSDQVLGQDGNDQLAGAAGNDILMGGKGRDTLWGGIGDDQLTGGIGADILYGNAGRDTFVLGREDGRDTIRDYRDQQDKINLVDGLTFGDISIQQQGQDTLLKIGDSPLALLSHVKATLITASDFI